MHADRVITQFIARRTIRSATFVALMFGVFSASKVIGYVDIYPHAQDRVAAGALMLSNVGFIALFGKPVQIETVGGYASWYCITMGVLLGGIWAYLMATKTFRGEEAAGRWELLLAGPTTVRRATTSALAGLGLSLGLFYVLVAAALIAIGRYHGIDYGLGAALYFALAAVVPAVLFAAVGAFTSQLMATRARAAGLATAIFGVSFLLRAAGDITSAHWIRNLSPLGWIEQLQPLTGPQPLWLVPILGLTALLAGATVYLAGRRDVGASLIADRDTAKPHLRFLGSPLGAAWRFTRASSVAWALAFVAYMSFFGALTTTATKMLSSSSVQQLYAHLTQQATQFGARSFLGIAFWMAMPILMAYAASAVGAMRSDEAQGYLDHFLVRPISRQRWFWSRIFVILAMLIVVAGLVGPVLWLSMGSNHYGLLFKDIVLASLNILPVAIFTLGAGLCVFGLKPRFATIAAYGLIAWSFIIELLSSGTNLSIWLQRTSLFHYVAYAPATDPKWGNAAVMVALGILMALIGALAFNRRDLATE